MSITNSRMLFNTAVGHRKVDLPKQQSHKTPYHWVFGAFKKRHLPLQTEDKARRHLVGFVFFS